MDEVFVERSLRKLQFRIQGYLSDQYKTCCLKTVVRNKVIFTKMQILNCYTITRTHCVLVKMYSVLATLLPVIRSVLAKMYLFVGYTITCNP